MAPWTRRAAASGSVGPTVFTLVSIVGEGGSADSSAGELIFHTVKEEIRENASHRISSRVLTSGWNISSGGGARPFPILCAACRFIEATRSPSAN